MNAAVVDITRTSVPQRTWARKVSCKVRCTGRHCEKKNHVFWATQLVINSMPAHPLMPSVSLLQSQSRVWHPNSAEATTMMCFLLGCRVRGPGSVFLHPPCATLRSICLVTPTGSRSYVHHTVATTMRTPNLFSLDKRFQLFLAASRGSVASSVVVSFSPGCIQNTASDSYIFLSTSWGIFSCTPEPHIAFCPIFVHALFPCLNPMFKNGSFFFRRRPLTFHNGRQTRLMPTFGVSAGLSGEHRPPFRGSEGVWGLGFGGVRSWKQTAHKLKIGHT